MQEFSDREWLDLCNRTKRTAEHFAALAKDGNADFVATSEAFATQSPPTKYDELLNRCRETRDLAVEVSYVAIALAGLAFSLRLDVDHQSDRE